MVVEEKIETDANKGMMCVPIGAIFHVLNWSHVHLISLDTETTEPYILIHL
jgi:hypothetical protein